MSLIDTGLLYARTLRYLKPVQISNRVLRRFRRPRRFRGETPELRKLGEPEMLPLPKPVSLIDETRCRLLNVERVAARAAAWNDRDADALWLYHLHYFDDLCSEYDGGRSDLQLFWIGRWLDENPPYEGLGWDPYPISLRLVNWSRWQMIQGLLPEAAVRSMAVQSSHLAHTLEYHLQGNHLLANAKALVFAGCLFQGRVADGWLDTGLRLLERQLPKQILKDGGHFELSPMYHSIVTEDLLDLIWLSELLPVELGNLLPSDEWKRIAARMVPWLGVMTHPDGEIALFNDAACGHAQSYGKLAEFARNLGVGVPNGEDRCALTVLEDSGYARIHGDSATVIFDIGEIGAPCVPAHGHADVLSVEMSLFGQRVFVNGGTRDYRDDAERVNQRSTSSHNTVVVNGLNSSEIWRSFRVARRARPLDRRWNNAGGRITIAAAHDGFRRIAGAAIHTRTLTLAPGSLEVVDVLTGAFETATARYQFAPECFPELRNGEIGGVAVLPNGRTLRWLASGGRCRIEKVQYHPRFYDSQSTYALLIDFVNDRLSVSFTWE